MMLSATATTDIPRTTTKDKPSQPSLKHTEHPSTVASTTETVTARTSSVFIASSVVDSNALSDGQLV